MNILLTSAGRRTYLVDYFKEALCMAGLTGLVHAANSENSPAFLAADRQVVTPLIYDPEYIPFLLDYCRKWEIELLVPLFDIDLPVLSRNKKAFSEQGTRVVAAEPAAIEICNDKWKTCKALQAEGILTPESWLDMEAAIWAVKEGQDFYPLILKPRWGMGSLSVYQADDEEELRVFYGKICREIQGSYLKYEAAQQKEGCVLIQEKITGREFGMDVVNDLRGTCRAVVVKEKANMRAGETDAAITISSLELEQTGRHLSKLLGHPGNLDVDILESGGQYYVLELNGRFGGGYPFSHAAGLHLPYALVMWASGREPEEKALKAQAGVRAMKDIQILVQQ